MTDFSDPQQLRRVLAAGGDLGQHALSGIVPALLDRLEKVEDALGAALGEHRHQRAPEEFALS
jgi:hypothetical protein